MLRQQARFFRNLTILLDILVVSIAFLLAHYFTGPVGWGGDKQEYALVLLIVFPIWFGLFAYFNLYSSLRTRSLSEVLSAVVKIHFAGAIAASSLLYLAGRHGSSRMFFGVFVLVSLALIGIEKTSVKLFLGHPEAGVQLPPHPDGRRQRAGATVYQACRRARRMGIADRRQPAVGGGAKHPEICMMHAVDEVVVCLSRERMVEAEEVRHMLQDMGITVRMVPDGPVFLPLREELSYFHDEIPMVTYYGKPFVIGQLFLKRCLDVAGALAGLGLTVFLFPFIALAIRLDSPGPLFFRQVRVGRAAGCSRAGNSAPCTGMPNGNRKS